MITDTKRIPVARSIIAGFLMGMAMLVPGISGGTMILVMGLYDEFIRDIADVTRLRFTRRNITFLAVLAAGAVTSIVLFAGIMSRAVVLYPGAMFSLFIGLTLGGVPLLVKILKGFNTPAVIGAILGFALVVGIAWSKEEPPDKDTIRQSASRGRLMIQPHYTTDFFAGVLGMSAMILPGVSGAYMFLILHRYETILAAVAMTQDFIFSQGHKGDPVIFLKIILPTALGAVISLILFSNFLKWMLRKHEKLMIGILLGILSGSVVGIWPFDQTSSLNDILLGTVLVVTGFFCTAMLSRMSV